MFHDFFKEFIAQDDDVLETVGYIAILLLLAMAFHTFPNLTLVLANLPFALAGGVLAIFFSILLALALRYGRFERTTGAAQ